MKKIFSAFILSSLVICSSTLSGFVSDPTSTDESFYLSIEYDNVRPDQIDQYESGVKELLREFQANDIPSKNYFVLRNTARPIYAYVIQTKDSVEAAKIHQSWGEDIEKKMGAKKWLTLFSKVSQTLSSYGFQGYIYLPELSYIPGKAQSSSNQQNQPKAMPSTTPGSKTDSKMDSNVDKKSNQPSTSITNNDDDDDDDDDSDDSSSNANDNDKNNRYRPLPTLQTPKDANSQSGEMGETNVHVAAVWVYPGKQIVFEELLHKWAEEQKQYQAPLSCKVFFANVGEELPAYYIVGNKDCLWGILKSFSNTGNEQQNAPGTLQQNVQFDKKMIRRVIHSDWAMRPDLSYKAKKSK